MSTKPYHRGGSFESQGPALSYTDLAAAYLELVAGGAYARVGAKGPGSVGAKLSSVLAGVIKDALTAAANGDLTTLGPLVVAGVLTPQALLDLSGASAGQIKFPATQNASSNVNTLDDYEEGTWTPTIDSDAGAATGQTYSTQAGNYTKSGNKVTLSWRVVLTNKGTMGAGNAVIKGFPFTLKSGITARSTGAASFGGLATNWVSVIFDDQGASSSASYIQGLAVAAAGVVNLQNTDISNTTSFNGLLTYFTD